MRLTSGLAGWVCTPVLFASAQPITKSGLFPQTDLPSILGYYRSILIGIFEEIKRMI
ncbi:MAG: hypothetical protein RTV72_08770 [Candidatus Thorarchaeota archaeon]